MTITYKEGDLTARGAGFVSTDWRALWRLLKKWEPEIAGMEYLRVMELTKNGIPHHHLVIGPIPRGMRDRCWKYTMRIREYKKRFSSCECLAHRVARLWLQVTKDSYIVHATPVYGAGTAGGYMGKYMQKEFDGEEAEALGMARRWSTFRGWPGSGRLRLRVTGRKGWQRTSWAPHHVDKDILGGPPHLLVREGDDLTFKLKERQARKRLVTEVSEYVVDGSEANVRL